MKKVFALVLAVAMLSVMAIAVGGDWKPGDKVTFSTNADGISFAVDGAVDGDTAFLPAPGLSGGEARSLNTGNYSIKRITYGSGRNVVSSVTLDSEEGNALNVNFKSSYSTDKLQAVDIRIDLQGKKHRDNGNMITPAAVTFALKGTFGLGESTIYISPEGNLYLDETCTQPVNWDEYTSSTSEDFVKFKAVKGGMPYANVTIDGASTSLDFRAYEGDKFVMITNHDADRNVLIANADSGAEITFINFSGNPALSSTGTLSFYDVDENGYVYENRNGRLVKSAAKWDSEAGCWILKTRTLGNYILSDKPLVSSAATSTDSSSGSSTVTPDGNVPNPGTGANDVVGVAAALAVVSLVAAGAVSLKKKN